MQILLANAKIMNEGSSSKPISTPLFQSIANELAMEMASLDIDELAKQLDCSRKLASQNKERYHNFFNTDPMPAIMAYNGHAYKHLKASTLSTNALNYGQEHLWITCFLYGLLRPMDGIVPYRMEHCVTLETTNERPINQFWKDKLTDILIHSVKEDDGILIHLSTEEYEHLFDWHRIKKEVRVIQPLFYVRTPKGLKIQSVWAKACRGAMLRFILENQLEHPDALQAFQYEGFKYTPHIGEADFPHFIRE